MGGLVTSISKEFVADCSSIVHYTLSSSRALVLFIDGPVGKICNVNAHIAPNGDDSNKNEDLIAIKKVIRKDTAFVAGDFNFPATDDGRLLLETGESSNSQARLAMKYDNLFSDMTELAQIDFTRRQVQEGRIISLSRIDRIYSNLPTPILSEHRPSGS